jgi:hypothetical protein
MKAPSRRMVRLALAMLATMAALQPSSSSAQTTVKGALPAAIAPPWSKGIQAINQENYWNAVSCGKQGGARPLCVFYDADVCRNGDFEMALFTPYKMVAYEVWRAVRAKQEPPTPSYAEAQRTRISVKLTPKPGANNPVTGIAVKRGAQAVKPVSQSLDGGAGTFIFDFAAFAPTSDITIDMIGKARTVACAVDRTLLARFR